MHDAAPADGGVPPAKRGPGVLAAADCDAAAPTVPTLAPIGSASAALPPLSAPGVQSPAGMNGMAGGQVMDMAADSATYDLRTITRLQQLKTGALLAASVEMGAIMGKIAPEGRAPLRAYARDIGLAFQIADDLLDVEGDEETVGKAVGKDSEQGKQTFVTLMGVDGARTQSRALVEQAAGHLAPYGEDAGLLAELARFIVERDR